jgi:hypothetical protein
MWKPDFLFLVAQQPLVGQGLFGIEPSRSHLDTPNSLRFLWTSDQPDAETSTWQHTTLTRDRQLWHRLDLNPKSQPASGCRPTPYNARLLGSAVETRYCIQILLLDRIPAWDSFQPHKISNIIYSLLTRGPYWEISPLVWYVMSFDTFISL